MGDRRARWRRRWLLGWDARRGRLSWRLCPSSVNLPRLHHDRWEGGGYVGLSWGNGNSDPVWSVEWTWGTTDG